jgi:hypothetical protein
MENEIIKIKKVKINNNIKRKLSDYALPTESGMFGRGE